MPRRRKKREGTDESLIPEQTDTQTDTGHTNIQQAAKQGQQPQQQQE